MEEIREGSSKLLLIFDVVEIGLVFLILYIIIDFIRNRTSNLLKRVIIYSFVFYILNVIQLTTGGIYIPPQKEFIPQFQLVPFYFIGDWISIYQNKGFDWFFWHSVKLSFYNLIMLFPLGVYLSVLFRVKRSSIAILTVFLSSLIIEIYQVVLAYLGLVGGRTFNIDDLLLNTLGGSAGFLTIMLVTRLFESNHYWQGKREAS